jgi:hypothetical protein
MKDFVYYKLDRAEDMKVRWMIEGVRSDWGLVRDGLVFVIETCCYEKLLLTTRLLFVQIGCTRLRGPRQ